MITVGTRIRFTRNLFIEHGQTHMPMLVAARGELGTIVRDGSFFDYAGAYVEVVLATWDRGGGLHFEVKPSDFTVEETEECDVEAVGDGLDSSVRSFV